MKSLFLALALVGGVAHAAPPARSMFTDAQEKKVIAAVKEACTNAWCEGDLGYNFTNFHCEKSTCQLDFEIISYTRYLEDGAPDPASAEKVQAVCKFGPVKGLNDILNRKRDYVSSNYFLSLAKCIDGYAVTLGSNPEQGIIPVPPPPPNVPLPVDTGEEDFSLKPPPASFNQP